MKKIELRGKGRGKYALFDDEDFDIVKNYKWYLLDLVHNTYAYNYDSGKKRYMHRIIMSMTDPKIRVDHKDHNGLNNQKNNLRICTVSQNLMNMQSNTGKSKFKGVTYHAGKWRAYINFDKQRTELGRFVNEVEAAKAYNKKAIEVFGEFARLNEI